MFFVFITHASFLTSVQYIPDIHSGGKFASSVISIRDLKCIFVVVAVVDFIHPISLQVFGVIQSKLKWPVKSNPIQW
jgi:hypothetical protein